MSDSQPEPPEDFGIYQEIDQKTAMDPSDKIAWALTGLWITFCVLFVALVGIGDSEALGPLRYLVLIIAVGLPVALIWIASMATKSSRVMRAESARLKASMDKMHQVYAAQAKIAATTMGPNVERKIDEIVKGQKRAENALARFSTSRIPSRDVGSERSIAPEPKSAPQREEQQALDLETSENASGPPVTIHDLISAMNFPETADDVAGFAALRRALQDPRVAKMIQASQDVLTLLSQDGIYMDDLTPDRAKPEIWRRFAAGERGRPVAGLGGIRDRSSLALTSARMRKDSIFRDTAHHFLRTFDKTLASVADALSDSEMIAMAETRTARAFMLLGRVAGMFD